MSTEYDVAVIGAGVVGCAIARELAGYNLRVALIEARNDVGDATSKASTAILHTGFDATPGTLESKLVRRGYELWCDFAQRTQVAVDRTGALLVAWDEEQLQTLPTLAEKARANGYSSTRLVDAAQVYATVPDLGPGARGGLEVPDESVIDSWGAVLALATDAVNRGVVLHLSARVTGVAEDRSTLHTTAGDVAATWIETSRCRSCIWAMFCVMVAPVERVRIATLAIHSDNPMMRMITIGNAMPASCPVECRSCFLDISPASRPSCSCAATTHPPNHRASQSPQSG